MPLMNTALAGQYVESLDQRTKQIFDASVRIEQDMVLIKSFLTDYTQLSKALSQSSDQQVAQQAPAAKKSNRLVNDMIKVANRLDQLGLTKEADLIDQLIEDMASEEAE
jgi:hypothetical protein